MKHSQIRKSLSLILAIIMMISTCAVAFSASAADETDSALDAYVDFIMNNDEVVAFYLDADNYTERSFPNKAKSRNYRVYSTDDYDMYLSLVEMLDITYAASLEIIDSYEPSINSTVTSDFTAWNTYTVNAVMYAALEEAGASSTQLEAGNSLCLGSHASTYNPTSKTSKNVSATVPEVSYVGSIITTTDLQGYIDYLNNGGTDLSMAYALNFNMHTFSQYFEENNVTYYIRYFAYGDVTVGPLFAAEDINVHISEADTTTDGLYPVIIEAIEALAFKNVVFYAVDDGFIYVDYTNGDVAGVIVGYEGTIVDLVIPEGVVEIEDSVFKSCSTLETVVIPSTMTTIGIQAFRSCSSLKSVKISGNVDLISMYAFAYCYDLEYVCITGAVQTIDYKAFVICPELKTVTLSSSITSIHSTAFETCDDLQTVYFAGTEEEFAALASAFDSDVEIIFNHVCEDADGDGLCDVCEAFDVEVTAEKVELAVFKQIIATIQEYFEAILAIFKNFFSF